MTKSSWRSERERRQGLEDAVCARGFVVRRSTYDAVGGMMPGVGSFAVPLLGKKLAESGVRFDWAPKAVLVHYNISTVEQPAFCVADYINGEYDWRASVPELQAWEMFGAPPIWSCRGDTVPRHARAAARALVHRAASMLATQSAHDFGQSLKVTMRCLRALLPTMIFGARSLVRKADAAARETENRLREADRDAAGITTFREHWLTFANTTAWHRVERAETPPAIPELGSQTAVDCQHLFGLSPPEHIGNRWLRRIRGVAGMQLPVGLVADAIDIRVEPLPGPGELMVFWNGTFVGVVPAGATTARVTIPHTNKNGGKDRDMLVLIDDAYPLPRWGAAGPVPLGMRKRNDIAWVDVVVHAAKGSRTFTVSPAATSLIQ